MFLHVLNNDTLICFHRIGSQGVFKNDRKTITVDVRIIPAHEGGFELGSREDPPSPALIGDP